MLESSRQGNSNDVKRNGFGSVVVLDIKFGIVRNGRSERVRRTGSGLVQRVLEHVEGKQGQRGRDFSFSDSGGALCPVLVTGCPKFQVAQRSCIQEWVRVAQLTFRVGAWTLTGKGPGMATKGPEAMPKGIRASRAEGPAWGVSIVDI